MTDLREVNPKLLVPALLYDIALDKLTMSSIYLALGDHHSARILLNLSSALVGVASDALIGLFDHRRIKLN